MFARLLAVAASRFCLDSESCSCLFLQSALPACCWWVGYIIVRLLGRLRFGEPWQDTSLCASQLATTAQRMNPNGTLAWCLVITPPPPAPSDAMNRPSRQANILACFPVCSPICRPHAAPMCPMPPCVEHAWCTGQSGVPASNVLRCELGVTHCSM